MLEGAKKNTIAAEFLLSMSSPQLSSAGPYSECIINDVRDFWAWRTLAILGYWVICIL